LNKESIKEQFIALQNSIVLALENADTKGKFNTDLWERAEGGGGITKVIENGHILEKGGVNFSAVHGNLSSNVAELLHVKPESFFATGVSIVIHPHNPFVPIIHMNIRYFELENGNYWFGGGIDLTPHYIDKEQAKYFHTSIKTICDKYDSEFYPKFKSWADSYFYITHREETRGIGGVFFDRLSESNTKLSKDKLFDFVIELGQSFASIYTHLMQMNSNKEFTNANKRWQLLRRGRYVEFNLIYDRGTRFGLETGGRIESILMSLPLLASWEYDVKVEPESQESFTLNLLKQNIDWFS
jgi:coproporphyrinogen III oxidase